VKEMELLVKCDGFFLPLKLRTQGLIRQTIASLERTNYVSCDLKTGLWSVQPATKRKALTIKALRERLTASLKPVKARKSSLS
jgi:hypothetical protein